MSYQCHGIIQTGESETVVSHMDRRTLGDKRRIRISLAGTTASFYASTHLDLTDAKRLRDALDCAIRHEEQEQEPKQ